MKALFFGILFYLTLLAGHKAMAKSLSQQELLFIQESLTPLNCGDYAKDLKFSESHIKESRKLLIPSWYFSTDIQLSTVEFPALLNDMGEIIPYRILLLSLPSKDIKNTNLSHLRYYLNLSLEEEFPPEGPWSMPALQKTIGEKVYMLLFPSPAFWFREAFPPYVTNEDLIGKCYISSLYLNSKEDLFFDKPIFTNEVSD